MDLDGIVKSLNSINIKTDDIDWYAAASTPDVQHTKFLHNLTAAVAYQVHTHFKETHKKLQTAMEAMVNEKILQVKMDMESQITELKTRVQSLQGSLDQHVAVNLQKDQNATVVSDRLDKVESTCVDLRQANDGVEQQGRKETVEFHNIPYRYDVDGTEDTTDMVVEICRHYLGMRVSHHDISVSHRQEHPDEKAKLGVDYIPPIYCKFVRRTLARAVIERRDMIGHIVNTSNRQKIFVRENLTLSRRILWNRVSSELSTFTHKWVKNGKIFVQKSVNTRAIQVVTDKVLDDLLTLSKHVKSKPITKASNDQSSQYGVNPRNRWPRKKLSNLSSNSSPAIASSAPRRVVPALGDYMPRRFAPPLYLQPRRQTPISYKNAVQRPYY